MRVFGTTYKPRSIKVTYESKNAFITANSQDEAQKFVSEINEIISKDVSNLYFSLYKSKQERTSGLSSLKKYNYFEQNNQMNLQPQQMIGGYPMGQTGKIMNNFCIILR